MAVVTAIDLTNASSRRAFDLSTETLIGRTTHQLVGGPSGIPEPVYANLRIELGELETAPIVEGWALAPAAPGRGLRLLGIDPLAEARLRPTVADATLSSGALSCFLTSRSAIVTDTLAAALGVDRGDRIELEVEGRPASVELCAVIATDRGRRYQGFGDLLLVDIATAQELTGRDSLNRIDLRIVGSDVVERERAIAADLPPGIQLVGAQARSESLYQMTNAFRLNLMALSLLALVVGMFLIYNTMTFSVVQRRTLLGRLRALGTTRRQLFGVILLEALVIGTVGTVLGLVLGTVLAGGLVRLVTRTINDLYFALAVRELSLSPLAFLKAGLLGVVTSALAALAPAFEATQAPPRLVMSRISAEARARRNAPRLAWAGGGGLAIGVALLILSGRSIPLSFLSLFLIVCGFAFLTPLATVATMTRLEPLVRRRFGSLGRMAVRGVTANLSRTGVAIAALTIAVSVSVGVGIMIHSFRHTVVRWLDTTLQADIYLSPAVAPGGRVQAALTPELVGRLRDLADDLPTVVEVRAIRTTQVRWEHGDLDLVALDSAASVRRSFTFKAGAELEAWAALDDDDAVLVTEPLAYRHSLSVGDRMVVASDSGPVPLRIVGVVYDYGSDRGAALMSRTRYERHWRDRAISAMAFLVADPSSIDQVMGTIRHRVGALQAIELRSNRALRATSLEVFDRTFTVTSVLRLLATVVAFIGVLSSLMAMALERAHEFAVMRANGLTPGQLRRLVMGQTALMGAVAGVLSVVLGAILAAIMVLVINRRSFGWSLQLVVPPELLAQALLLAIGAAVIASLYPAHAMARTAPALALRQE